jgi:hypothetical protein
MFSSFAANRELVAVQHQHDWVSAEYTDTNNHTVDGLGNKKSRAEPTFFRRIATGESRFAFHLERARDVRLRDRATDALRCDARNGGAAS